jgi:hypothetical protein
MTCAIEEFSFDDTTKENGQGSCAFSGAIGSQLQRYKAGNADQEHHSTRDISLVVLMSKSSFGVGSFGLMAISLVLYGQTRSHV